MHMEIVTIGNSQGIRLPKSILEQCGFGKTVEAEVVDHQLIIKAIHGPRQGWKAAFSKADSSEEEFKDVKAITNEWDESEWQW